MAAGDREDVPQARQVGKEDPGHGRVVAAHVLRELRFGGDDAFGERPLLVPPAGRLGVCLEVQVNRLSRRC